MNLKSRIQGSIYGLLIGDALGVARSKKCQSSSLLISRYYSNAGGMTLCTISSLVDCEKIDPEDIANLFVDWYVAGYMVSHESYIQGNPVISQSIRHFNNGMPPDRCGDKTSLSDSALMRILPIAIWCYNKSIEEIVKQAHIITNFTNLNAETEVCSALLCLIVRGILLQKKEKVFDILKQYYEEFNQTEHITALNKVLSNTNSEVQNSFWHAWGAYADHQDDFDKVMDVILRKPNPSSTVSIAGALAGANVGIEEIPKRWLNQLYLPEGGQGIINKFVTMTLKGS